MLAQRFPLAAKASLKFNPRYGEILAWHRCLEMQSDSLLPLLSRSVAALSFGVLPYTQTDSVKAIT